MSLRDLTDLLLEATAIESGQEYLCTKAFSAALLGRGQSDGAANGGITGGGGVVHTGSSVTATSTTGGAGGRANAGGYNDSSSNATSKARGRSNVGSAATTSTTATATATTSTGAISSTGAIRELVFSEFIEAISNIAIDTMQGQRYLYHIFASISPLYNLITCLLVYFGVLLYTCARLHILLLFRVPVYLCIN
jgi:hypothetical protein